MHGFFVVQAGLLVNVSLATGLGIIESDDDFIGHAFVIVVEFAVRYLAGTDAGDTSDGFGMGRLVRNGKEGIATRIAFIADSNGARMAAHVFIEATGLGGTGLDLRHDDFDMFHNLSPDSV